MKIPCAEKESQNDEDAIKWREEKVSEMARNEPKWLEMGGREIQRNGGKRNWSEMAGKEECCEKWRQNPNATKKIINSAPATRQPGNPDPCHADMHLIERFIAGNSNSQSIKVSFETNAA